MLDAHVGLTCRTTLHLSCEISPPSWSAIQTKQKHIFGFSDDANSNAMHAQSNDYTSQDLHCNNFLRSIQINTYSTPKATLT